MKSLLIRLCLVVMVFVAESGLAGATLLDDNGKAYDYFYQEKAFAPGSYTLTFDYQIQKLGSAPLDVPFAFNDLFSAALYFADGTGQIDPANNIFPNLDASLLLLSLDTSANTNIQHFSYSFENTYAYIIPTFELFDLNFVDNDSAVLINNVTIETAPVPEPGTLLLLGGGLLGLYGVSRLRKRGTI